MTMRFDLDTEGPVVVTMAVLIGSAGTGAVVVSRKTLRRTARLTEGAASCGDTVPTGSVHMARR